MRYLGISVTHHGNEKVKEEEEDDEDEEEPVDPPDVLVVGVGEALPHDEGIARGHHEDHHDALHGARHRVLLRDVLLFHVKKKFKSYAEVGNLFFLDALLSKFRACYSHRAICIIDHIIIY